MLLTLDNLNTQKIEIHTLSEDISVIKVVSLLPSAENSNLITGTLLVLNIFYPNDCLVAIQILRNRELIVVAPISLALHIFFLLACNIDSNFHIYSELGLPTQNNQ